MAGEVKYGSLQFEEAIKFFRQKANLPTATWKDLWEGQHARAFVVAGATKAALLSDLRAAIDKAISQGTTLETFRKDFDTIVAKHGWSHNGGRNWRTKVMLETNMRTAYQAGRFEQMTDPETLKHRPFWEYRHGDSKRPRVQHLAWDGKVLAADDPWWKTHYPPNGWGCNCRVFALDQDDLEELGKKGPDKAPEVTTYQWTDKRTGEVRDIPDGIDPGWAYNVGEAAWGRPLAQQAMGQWAKEGAEAYDRLTPGTWDTAGLARKLKGEKADNLLPPVPDTQQQLQDNLGLLLAGQEQVFTVGEGAWKLPVLANAEALAANVALEDSPYLWLLPRVLNKPDEVWLGFERHKATGKVVLRVRSVKAVKVGERQLVLVAQAGDGGMLEGFDVLPGDELAEVNARRAGRLIGGKAR